MAYTLIRHSVADFDTWKAAFDAHNETRERYGQLAYKLFTEGDSDTDVSILFEFESREGARKHMEDPDLPGIMADAGVQGEPEFVDLELVESMTTEQPIA